MRENNKIIQNLVLLGILWMSLFSCETASVVNFESENYENFKNGDIKLEMLPDDFYFTRILTATCVELVFLKFSKNNAFKEMTLKNIVITDDMGKTLYKNELLDVQSHDSTDILNDCAYKLYYYEIPTENFNRVTLKNHNTKYLMFSFEIDGKKYSEKLKRVEKKYLVLPT